MIDTKISCDVCGVERKAVNHWYLVRVNRSGFHVIKQRQEGDRDVCGQACAHKLLDRFLATGKLDKPEVQHQTTEEVQLVGYFEKAALEARDTE